VKNPVFDLSIKEASYLIALLEADRQTALQLLAADHFYEPSLLPRLKKFQQLMKNKEISQGAATAL
jgi:hypothetical protein